MKSGCLAIRVESQRLDLKLIYLLAAGQKAGLELVELVELLVDDLASGSRGCGGVSAGFKIQMDVGDLRIIDRAADLAY